MSEAIVDESSEKERACLKHHHRAQALGISFAEYCRERDLRVNEWYWVRSGLMRKGVIANDAMMRPTGEDVKVYLYRRPVEVLYWERNGFAM